MVIASIDRGFVKVRNVEAYTRRPLSGLPLLLACDTSASVGSVALSRHGAVIGACTFETSRGHSHHFLGEIEKLLEEASSQLRDVTHFAAVIGPGSFTGLRVSLASIRGLAAMRPCAGALASDVVAFGVRARATTSRLLVLLDLFHEEVFGAVYSNDGTATRMVAPHAAGTIEAVIGELSPPLRNHSVTACGSGATKHSSLLQRLDVPISIDTPLTSGLAGDLARWAGTRPDDFVWKAATDILPFYLRDPLTRAITKETPP